MGANHFPPPVAKPGGERRTFLSNGKPCATWSGIL
jgi:hypothetical protein